MENYISQLVNEIKNSSENFKKNVGYFDLLLIKKDIRFLLLNSSSDVKNIKIKLKNF